MFGSTWNGPSGCFGAKCSKIGELALVLRLSLKTPEQSDRRENTLRYYQSE
jgi:hypothetical protein